MPWQKAKGNTRYLEAVFCFGEPALTKGIFLIGSLDKRQRVIVGAKELFFVFGSMP